MTNESNEHIHEIENSRQFCMPKIKIKENENNWA